MVSVYGYITLANLEAYATVDYSGLAPAYSDAQVEASISFSERLINSYMLATYTGTIPDGIIAATLELSYRIMYNRMVDDGAVAGEYRGELRGQYEEKVGKKSNKYMIAITDDIKTILDTMKFDSRTWVEVSTTW